MRFVPMDWAETESNFHENGRRVDFWIMRVWRLCGMLGLMRLNTLRGDLAMRMFSIRRID
jgi:hypothetical protein